MQLGFCGVGLMGKPMVRRLLDAGHDVLIWNRTAARTTPLAEAGARVVDTPAQLAEQCSHVVMCLFDWRAVQSVVFDSDGLVQGGALTHVIDHSSIPVDKTREFAQRLEAENGARWLDAPVSGGVGGAEQGTLAIMAGGQAEDLLQIEPALRAYARSITHMGPTGAGQATKLCNQTIVSTTIAAIAEAVALAQSSGVDAARLNEALAGGWADSILLQTFVPRMTSPPQAATATIDTMLKDLQTIAGLAGQHGTSMPVSTATRELYRQAAESGLGQEDVSRLLQAIRRPGASI